MKWRAPEPVDRRIKELIADARRDSRAGEVEDAWLGSRTRTCCLNRGPYPHVRVHAAMLGMGWRTRDAGEVGGQLFRLVVAAPGSLTGRYPAGNSGRADVSAFAAAPVREDLAELLAFVEPAQDQEQEEDR
jgi:hypothetical protein